MKRPLKRSIAVVVQKGSQLLSVQRADDDDELPGIWGLPAGSYRGSETREELIRRIGHDKLGVAMTPLRLLASGAQDRTAYRIQMELWAVAIDKNPSTLPTGKAVVWKWVDPPALQEGSAKGSLCCQLALQAFTGHDS